MTTPPTDSQGCACARDGGRPCAQCTERHDLLSCPHGEFPGARSDPKAKPIHLQYDGQTTPLARPDMAATFNNALYAHRPGVRTKSDPTSDIGLDAVSRGWAEVQTHLKSVVAQAADRPPAELVALWTLALSESRNRANVTERVRAKTGTALTDAELAAAALEARRSIQEGLDQKFGKGVSWKPRQLRPHLEAMTPD